MSSEDWREEPRTALARWDALEEVSGKVIRTPWITDDVAAEVFRQERLVQPLIPDQTRHCLHPSADHGTLGCNTCGCPRGEDDHLGALCRWPAPEDGKAIREPWFWRPGMHMDRFPHGMLFEPKQAEPADIKPWTGSIVDLMGNPAANEAEMFALDSEGVKIGEPVRLLGPFYFMNEGARLVEFIAWGGKLDDPHERVITARGVRITRLDADGKPSGPSVALEGVRDVIVSLGPVVQETAVALGHLGRAALSFTAQLKRFTYSRVLNAFYVADRIMIWINGRPAWIHRSWVRPMRALGVTRRQRRSPRRIHRRRSR